ncbi:MAG TPA: type II toxin-antitoxin system VapC family toxin [Tepidisphaeraceae bacterium]|jgi:predicted nucleic acid-binding protein|nr:type II toxin-antitoxin system VapC family toxin [Tepidisphaeraceae bacterium]
MATKPRVAWDSVVLLDAIQKTPLWWPDLRPTYRAALEGRISILVSEISIAEVCKLNDEEKSGMSRVDAVKKINLFFQNSFIDRRPADRREAILAAELIRSLNLDTCDALIVATASIHGAIAMYTRDGLKLRKNKTCPLQCDGKVGEPALPIMLPSADKFLNSPLFRAAREQAD